uniref:Gamma-glutamyltransferase n=1 Tax=Caenorhabditis japonica TaxID=281687 RepID=A0A8R1EMM1_CAEJA
MEKWLFDIPWIIILVQFIVILALVLGLFAFFLIRSDSSQVAYSTRTYQNFELQTISPRESPLTFRKLYKTTSESSVMDFDFSEDHSGESNGISTSQQSNPPVLVEEAIQSESINSLEAPDHEENLRAAVFTQSHQCSEIGKSVLVRGGNAVDAAISTSFCLMGALPNKASLAGGMIMIVRSKDGRNVTTIMARESAPLNTKVEELKKNPGLAKVGSKAVGTPGVLNGLFRAFQKFSSARIQWKHLVLPTIQHCIR